MRRFELSDGVSNKFWEVELDHCSINVRFGKIGTAGQSQSKAHPDQAKAALALDKLVKEKTAKGYVETGVAPSAAPIAATPKPAQKPAPAPTPAPAPAPAPQWRRVGPAPAARPPAPIVHPGQSAPWLATGAVIDMPAKLAALALPSRRFPGAVPPADANACWEQFLARARKHISIEATTVDIDYLAGVAEAGKRLALHLELHLLLALVEDAREEELRREGFDAVVLLEE